MSILPPGRPESLERSTAIESLFEIIGNRGGFLSRCSEGDFEHFRAELLARESTPELGTQERAVRDIPESELPGLARWLAMELVDEKRAPELRAVLNAIDPARVLATLERIRHRRGERQAEAQALAERKKARIEEESARDEERAQHRLLWADFLETHRDEIEALRTEPAPVELPQGAVRWVALLRSASGRALGFGTGATIEEAHRAYIAERIALFATPEDSEDALGAPPAELSELALLPSCYVRIVGPEDVIDKLSKVL